MKYLDQVIITDNFDDVKSQYMAGSLVVTDNQQVIDACRSLRIPVAAWEHDDITGLSCDYILTDIDQVEDEVFENIYRRWADIPWDIAETDRCYIREFELDDLDEIYDMFLEPGATDFIPPLYEYEKEREYRRQYIDQIYKVRGFGQWVIVDKETYELVGEAGIEVKKNCFLENQAELGYLIAPHRQREGLGYEVCSCLLKLAKERYGFDSVMARCHAENVASVGLLEKLGFSYESTLEDGLLRYLIRL